VSALDAVIEKIERARIAYNSKAILKIVAVSKYVDAKEIERLLADGQRAFGESKIQDLKQKSDLLCEHPIEWHFIGRIQTNKINALLELEPHLIHSIDSFESAAEIDKRAKVKNKKMSALLQINSAKEESKAGVMPEIAMDEYHKIASELSNIELKGVMTIGAHTDETAKIKESFEVCRNIFEKLEKSGASICSMGMSSDFEIAIASGANMLRLGSILFQK